MKRTSLILVCTCLVLLLPLVGGCAKKKPVTPEAPEAAPPPAPAQTVTEAPTPTTTGDMQPDPLSEDIQSVNAYVYESGLIGDVYFDFDRYELKDEARERLQKNAAFMKAHPEFVFSLEGHCDERGTNEYNLALGDRRASAAQQYLADLGVGGSGMQTISYGEERPVCTESNESCWWRNRRAHFVITARR